MKGVDHNRLEVTVEHFQTLVKWNVAVVSASIILVRLGGTNQHRILEPSQVANTEIPHFATRGGEESAHVKVIRSPDFNSVTTTEGQELGKFPFEESVPSQILWGLGTGGFKFGLGQVECSFHN